MRYVFAAIFLVGALWLADKALVLLLICFLAFSVLHEVFYQRIFWLGIGVVLAGRAVGAVRTSKTLNAASAKDAIV